MDYHIICDNPFVNLYEVDAQVQLAIILENHSIKREKNYHESINYIHEFDICKIHREYPPSVLFDNVVLGEPKYFENINVDYLIGYEAFYHQPIKYAIELKMIPLYQHGTLNADKSLDDYI